MGAVPVLKILFVEDLPSDMELAERELRKEGLSFASLRVETKQTFLQALREFQPDLVVSDYAMPAFDGMQALKLSLGYDPSLPVIILTGAMNEDTAVECMKAGAVDYVIKEHIARLPLAVSNALGQKANRRANEVSERELGESEENLRLALDATNLGTWRHDLLTGQIHFDERARNQFGFDLEHVLFTDVLARVHPDDAPRIEQAMAAARDPAGDGRVSIEHRLIRPGGILSWLSVIGRTYFEGEGVARRAVLFVGTTRDISDRKQMEEALRQRLVEAEAQYTLSAALRTANTVDEALPVLLDQTLAALDSQAGNIWMYNPAAGDLRLAVTRGWFRQLYGTSLIPGQAIAGVVFSSGQVYQTADMASDPLANLLAGIHIPSGQAGICVPIRTAEKTIGVLIVSLPADRQVNAGQIKLITSLTEMAGVALQRIRLHEETVRHLKQLEVVRAIDQAITSSMDLKLTLNILLGYITSQLNVDAASILLLQPLTGILDFAAGHGFRTLTVERSRGRLPTSRARGTAPLRLKTPSELRQAGSVFQAEGCGLERAELMADEGFVTYHCVSLVVKGVQKGILEIFHRSPLDPDAEWLNFLETLAGQAAIAIDNYQLFENLQLANWNLSDAYDATIEGWSHALDLRDKETEGHTLRVADLTLKLARQMGMPDTELTFIRWGALLHDIGKMGVPDQILLKPGPLSAEEWVIMQKHPRFAFELLTPILYLGRAVDIPYCHHEKWDGTGYPRGLRGEEIPLIARIFSIVDVWDAICSDRPYRPAFTQENALIYILAENGKSFDPKVVEAFMAMINNNRAGE